MKKNWKARLVSGLLSLTMVASLLPAGVFTLPAKAASIELGTMGAVVGDNQTATVTFTIPGSGNTDLGNYSVVFVPNVSTDPGAVPSDNVAAILSGLTSASQLSGMLQGVATAYLQEKHDATKFTNNSVSFSFPVGAFETVRNALVGYYKPGGTETISADDTSIPMIVMLYGAKGFAGYATADWSSKANAELVPTTSPLKVVLNGDGKASVDDIIKNIGKGDSEISNISVTMDGGMISAWFTTYNYTLNDIVAGGQDTGTLDLTLDSTYADIFTSANLTITITYNGGSKSPLKIPVVVVKDAGVTADEELIFPGKVYYDTDGNVTRIEFDPTSRNVTLTPGESGQYVFGDTVSSGDPFTIDNDYGWDASSIQSFFDSGNSADEMGYFDVTDVESFTILPPGSGSALESSLTNNKIATTTDFVSILKISVAAGDMWEPSNATELMVRLIARLTPDFEQPPAAIYATFDLNGGGTFTGGGTTKQVQIVSGSVTAPTDYTATNCTFDGWYTAATGGTKVTSFTGLTGDVTYYAHWKVKATFDLNTSVNSEAKFSDNSTANKDIEVDKGAPVTMPTVADTASYTFNGWWTSASGGTQVSSIPALNANTTYYAHWTEKTDYTLTFNLNSGTGTKPADQTTKAPATANMTIPGGSGISRSGYYFMGWNTKADGSGTTYTSSDTPTWNAINTAAGGGSTATSVTLYAKWQKLYKIEFAYSPTSQTLSGSLPATWTQVTPTSAYPVPDVGTGSGKLNISISGYYFSGWTDQDGNAVTVGNSITPTKDMTLTANFVKSLALVYDLNKPNGVTDATNPTSITGLSDQKVGVEVTVTSTLPTLKNYKFNGWNTAADGSGTAYSAGDKFNLNADTTLHAQWTELPTITGGTFNQNPFKPNGTATASLTKLTLSDSSEVAIDTATGKGAKILQWVVGTDTGAAGVGAAGPDMTNNALDITSTTKTSKAVPAAANKDTFAIWVQVQGDGTNYTDDITWIKLPIGAVKFTLNVGYVLVDSALVSSKYKVLTDSVSGISVSGGPATLAANTDQTSASQVVSTTSVNDDYRFVGWSIVNSNFAPADVKTEAFEQASATANKKWLTGNLSPATITAKGVNSIEFYAPKLLEDATGIYTNTVTLYAVYQKYPTYEFTVAMDDGIKSVTVSVNGKVQKTVNAASSAADKTFSVKETDTVSVSSTPKDGYVSNGFTPAADVADNFDHISATDNILVCNILADNTVTGKTTIEIKALSKEKAPNLVPTPTDGKGNLNADKTITQTAAASILLTNHGGPTKITNVELKSVTADGTAVTASTYFELNTSTGLGKDKNTDAAKLAYGGTGTINITAKTAATSWTDAEYVLTFTVTYEDYSGASTVTKTKDVTVKYVVSEKQFTGKVIVMKDGKAATDATVRLDANSHNATNDKVGADGSKSFTALDRDTEYTVYVKLNDVSYTGKTKVTATNRTVTVNLYTVEVKLNDGTNEAAAMAGASEKVTLKLDSDSADIATNTAIASTTLTKVVQAGDTVKLNTDLTNANSGYAFDKWTVKDYTWNATGNKYDEAAGSDITGQQTTAVVNNKVLYTAYLKKANSKVALSYDANYKYAVDNLHAQTNGPAIAVPATQLVDPGTAATVNVSPKPVLPGFRFVKWNTKADGSGTDYDGVTAGQTSITITESTTLYAIWENATITTTETSVNAASNGVYGSYFNDTADFGAQSLDSNGNGVALRYALAGTVAANKLHGGLALEQNVNSCHIYGTPYEVASSKAVRIAITLAEDYHADGYKVTYVNGSDAFVVYNLTVGKATPTVTVKPLSATIVPGSDITTVGWEVTVTGPRFISGDGINGDSRNSPANDVWEHSYKDVITYTAGFSNASPYTNGKTTGVGNASFASSVSSTKFHATEGQSATITASFISQARGVGDAVNSGTATHDFDGFNTVWTGSGGNQTATAGKGNLQNTVWNDATGTVSVESGSKTYTLEVGPDAWTYWVESTHAPAHKNYAVDASATSGYVIETTGRVDKVNAKEFTLTNTGNQDITLNSAVLGKGTNSAFELDATSWNDLKTAGLKASGDANGEDVGTFKVKVKAGLDKGTYVDTLTITYATNKTAVIHLTFTVTDPLTYDGYIKVNTQAVGGAAITDAKAAEELPTGVMGTQMVIKTATGIVATRVPATDADTAHRGWYKLSGLELGSPTYDIYVGNTLVGAYPGDSAGDYHALNKASTTAITFSNKGDGTTTPVTEGYIYFYEIATTKDPAALTLDGDQTGAGYYAKGQSATITTPATGTLTAGDTTTAYVFENWKDGSTTLTNKVTTCTIANVTAAKEYTAEYEAYDDGKELVTYYLNATTTAKPNPKADVVKVESVQRGTVSNPTKYTVITDVPSRPGYIFDYWEQGTVSGNTLTVVGTGKYTNPAKTSPTTTTGFDVTTDPVDLFAHWTKGEVETPTDWAPGDQKTVYGDYFELLLGGATTTDGADVTYTASGLPGGLGIDPATGRLYGRSYEVGEFTVTVNAEHSVHGSDVKKSVTFKITVDKAQPVLTMTALTNGFTLGGNYTDAGYTGTVTGPSYNGRKNGAAANKNDPNNDVWEMKSWPVASANASTKPADNTTQGTLAVSASDQSGTFTAPGPWVINFTHTPDDTKQDAAKNEWEDVHKPATAYLKYSDTSTYTMSVKEDNRTDWSSITPTPNPATNEGETITMWGPTITKDSNKTHQNGFAAVEGYGLTASGGSKDGGNDANGDVNAQQFTITATGSVAPGVLTYTWGSTGAASGKHFTVTGITSGTTAISGNKDGNAAAKTLAFTVAPVAGLKAGEYNDTLVITNANGASVTVKVSFVVSEPEGYEITINTKHFYQKDNTTTAGKDEAAGVLENLSSYTNVYLKDVTTGVTDADRKHITLAAASGVNGVYTASGTNAAKYGHTYEVYLGGASGYKIPNLTITSLNKEATVDLYQVTIADYDNGTPKTALTTANGLTAASTISKTFVADGDSITVTVGSSSTYSFNKLTATPYPNKNGTAGDADTVLTATSGSTVYKPVINKPMAFEAIFVKGLTLTYDPSYTNVRAGYVSTSNTGMQAAAVSEGVEPGTTVLAKSADDMVNSDNGTDYTGWTRPGYTFTGWNTKKDGSGTPYAVGAGLVIDNMPATSGVITLYAQWEAAGELKLEGKEITAAFMEDVDLTIQATGGVDGRKYEAEKDGTALTSGTANNVANNITFTDGGTSGANAEKAEIKGTSMERTDKKVTVSVTVVDNEVDTDNTDTASADYVLNLKRAETEVTKPFTPPTSPKSGDPFDFTDLGATDLTVIAKKADGTENPKVDFQEKPTAADGTANDPTAVGPSHPVKVGGTWTVVKIDGEDPADPSNITYLPGEHEYTLKFTPEDTGFLPCETTVKITGSKLIIDHVVVGIVYPENGQKPETSTAGALKFEASDDGSPKTPETGKNYTDYVSVESIAWTSGVVGTGNDAKFDTTSDITVIALLKPKGDWLFPENAADFNGDFMKFGDTITLDNSATGNDKLDLTNTKVKDAIVLDGWTENGGYIMLTFEKENTKIDKVNVNTTDLVVGGTSTNWDVNTDDRPKYYVRTDSYQYGDGANETVQTHWVTHTGNTGDDRFVDTAAVLVGESNKFAKDTLYDAIVVIQAYPGYEFDDTIFGHLAVGVKDETTDIATVNGGKPPYTSAASPTATDDGHSYMVTTTLSADKQTLVIRYNSFKPVEKIIAGIKVEGAPGSYYAQTAREAEHYNQSATGNKSGKGFTFDPSGIRVYPIYDDGSVGTTPLPSNSYAIGKGVTTADFTTVPTDGFKQGWNPATSTRYDVDNWDGQTLYVQYTTPKETIYVAVPTPLVVKELEADSISVTNGPVLDYTGANKTFREKTGTSASVTFNTGDRDLGNTVTTKATDPKVMNWGSAPITSNKPDTTKTAAKDDFRPDYYYMLDSNGDGKVDNNDTELTKTTNITADMHGKDVYICYTDVNGNLVTQKVGPIKASKDFTSEIWQDGEKVDPETDEPEYGDELNGTPIKPDGTPDDPDKYTYQWERLKDGGDPEKEEDWVKIPGATGKDYTPGGDDTNKDIRVVITDKDTGTSVPSKEVHIYPRSIQFIVDRKDKREDGDALNKFPYTDADFHPTRVLTEKNGDGDWVNATKPHGGVLPGDEVTIEPKDAWNNTDNGRPHYQAKNASNEMDDSSKPGSYITWPEIGIAAAGDAVEVGKDNGYTVANPNYRLAPQGPQVDVGKITSGNVIHVDVSFKEWPTYSHVIVDEPMGVTDNRETMAASRTEKAADEQDYTVDTEWYAATDKTAVFDASNVNSAKWTRVNNPGTDTFGNTRYAVKVSVKPKQGYSYVTDFTDATKDGRTAFNFHFGEYSAIGEPIVVEVTKAQHTAQEGKGLWVHDGAYTMYYTFTEVDKPKIAYVDIDVPQPVVGGTPSAATVIRTLDEKGAITSDVALSPTTSGIWSGDLDSDGNFKAGVKYTATFTATVPTDYEYLFGDGVSNDQFVAFTVAGKGQLNVNTTTDNADGEIVDTMSGDDAIEKITIKTSNANGKTVYTITVVYNEVTGGSQSLNAVVVDAASAARDVEKTGPSVLADRPYELTGADNKWFYWDGGKWAEVTDAQLVTKDDGTKTFAPGYDYRVEAQVVMKADQKVLITDETAFYLAGFPRTMDGKETLNHGEYVQVQCSNGATKSDDGVWPADATFKLIKEFTIPAEEKNIDLVSVAYSLPLSNGDFPETKPASWGSKDIVTIAETAAANTNGTKWYHLGTELGGTGKAVPNAADFTKHSDQMTIYGTADKFIGNHYYLVEATITENSPYQFIVDTTDPTKASQISINGVVVYLDGDMGELKNTAGETIGWVKATSSTNATTGAVTVTAKLIARAESSDIDPIELKQDDITPVEGKKPITTKIGLKKVDETRYDVDDAQKNADETWTYVWEWYDETIDENTGKAKGWTKAEVSNGLDADGCFLGNTEYRVTVDVETKGENDRFADGASGTMTVGSRIYNADVEVGGDNTTATLTVKFDKTSVKNVTLVTAYFKNAPVVGEEPKAANSGYDYPERVDRKVETVGTLNPSATDLSANTNYEVMWFNSGSRTDAQITVDAADEPDMGTKMEAGDKFEVDTRYTVVVRVKPGDGYTYYVDGVDTLPDGTLATDFIINASNKGHAANVHKNANGTYYMWYTFDTMDLPKIAHVNVSIPQPIVEKTSTDIGNPGVNQVIHTDNTNDKTHVTLDNFTWYEGETGTTTLGAKAFEADKVYRAEFDLTAVSNYKYLYKGATPADDKNVTFIVSGVGPIEGAGPGTNRPAAIKSVTTSLPDDSYDANEKYHVVIVFETLNGGKVALTDVVVDASPATHAGVEKTGPEVTGTKPYKLTTNADGSLKTDENKWSYWDGSKWEAITDSNAATALDDGKFFKAGMEYRVEARVVLKADQKVLITDETKFYIAGYDVTTDDVVDFHPNFANEKALTASKPAVNGVYPADTEFTLIKTFKIPYDKISAVIIRYPKPVKEEEPLPQRTEDGANTMRTYEDLSAHVTVSEILDGTTDAPTNDTEGSKWYDVGEDAPTAANKTTVFDPNNAANTYLTGKFGAGRYYMVEGTIIADEPDYVFDDTVYVTINGIRVEVAADLAHAEMKTDYDAAGNEIGWAVAVKDGDAIKARYIAKTEENDTTNIYRVAGKVTAPMVGLSTSSAGITDEKAWFDNDNLTGNVELKGLTWQKSTTADFSNVLSAGAEFENGYYYRAIFHAAPKSGFDFTGKPGVSENVAFRFNDVDKTKDEWGINGTTKNDSAKGDNGITVTSEENNSNDYTITVSFPLTGKKTDLEVHGYVVAPTAGATIKASDITLKTPESYEAKPAPTDMEQTKWQHWDAAKNQWVDTVAGDEFLRGHYYRAMITAKLKDDQLIHNRYNDFTVNTKGFIDDVQVSEAALPNDAPSKALRASKTYKIAGDTTVTLMKEFRVAKEKIIEVNISSNKPYVAENGVYNINMDVKYFDAHTGYELSAKEDGASIVGQWYDADRNPLKDQGGEKGKAFEEGKTYYLISKVTAQPGYCLDDTKNGYHWVEYDLNQYKRLENESRIVDDDGDVVGYVMVFEYTIPITPTAKVDIVGFADPPRKNNPLGNIWTSKDFDAIDGSQKWTLTLGGEALPAGTTAAPGETYFASIEVAPKPGVDVTGSYFFNGYGEGDTEHFVEHIETVRKTDDGRTIYRLTYKFSPTDTDNGGGGGGGVVTEDSPIVYYHLKDQGVTDDPTAEKVRKNNTPKSVPKVTAMAGLVFKGWSEVDPSTLPAGTLPTLVDPTTFKITKDKWFYAVYEQGVDHLHYVIGFPNGTFGPDAKITRAEVATIIARSCLEGFVEGANYGNPGNYNDVSHHWAFSAIAFCAREGVFNGYEDGTFRPDRYITRQELATVVARLAGIQTSKGVPFNDAHQIASWAMNGIYTAYINGWIKGYEDSTFQPEREISRAETVKIFNGYLKRGVDAKGLEDMKEYIHTGVASNNRENGNNEYMTWPDVPKTHWAYLEIIEAANDHDFHWQDEEKKTPPEDWDKVYIDEKWRYNDNADDGAEKRDENMNAQKTFTVTYLVSSNGVTYDAITETVDRFESPKPENMPIAVPNEGYRFAGWSSTDPSTGTITLVDPTASGVTADKWFYAVFEEDMPHNLPIYTVTYVIGENGSYDGATVESVEMFQAPSVPGLPKPVAKEGYRFAGWSETDPADGGYAIMDPTANYVTGDKTFYAVYEAI